MLSMSISTFMASAALLRMMPTRRHAAAIAQQTEVVNVTPDKDHVYYNEYDTFSQQQGMLQDIVRTSVYQFAMLENTGDFEAKTVLDVGAGTGILSFFAAQAGAKRVYAVEASGMAAKAETLIVANGKQDVIEVLNQKVEEVELDERVDVLISEPLGVALVHERMLESYFRARDAHLKPGGKMFPSESTLYAAPFSDEALYHEQYTKAAFWAKPHFFDVDLSALHEEALAFYCSMPVVGQIAPQTICAQPTGKRFDFTTMSIEQLQKFEIPFSFAVGAIAQIHGIALWFDCTFPGSQQKVVLDTSPNAPLTHWQQVRCLLQHPLVLGQGHVLSGKLVFETNEARGYTIHMTLVNDNTRAEATSTVVTQMWTGAGRG